MQTVEMGEMINWAYSLGPISAIIAPFFLGMVADRFFDSEKVLGVLCLVAGVAMLAMPQFAGTGFFLPLLFIHALCYFPTLGLTASLSFHHLTNQEKEFPVVRVFGTIGWVVVSVVIGRLLQADATPWPLYIGGGLSIFLGIYSFTLPKTPPPSAGQKTSWKQIAGIDALRVLNTRSFIVFLVAATLIFIAFGTYFPYAPTFFSTMHEVIPDHFSNPSWEMSLGQFSEIFLMLAIPFLFVRFGVKWMLMIGMLAWVARFTLFSSAAGVIDPATAADPSIAVDPAASQAFWLIIIGIAIHGLCYDFFFVTGQIYIEKKTSPAIRGQVQGLLVLLTQGVGFFLGTQLSGAYINANGADGTLAIPDWQFFWLMFAGATLVFTIFFFFMFTDSVEKDKPVEVAS